MLSLGGINSGPSQTCGKSTETFVTAVRGFCGSVKPIFVRSAFTMRVLRWAW